jgi:hypothetical protein
MKVTVIRASSNEEEDVDLDIKDDSFILPEVYKLINCDCIDIVRLPQRKQIMLVDDNGYAKALEINFKATSLYHSVCRPGTINPIVGDVVLVREEDFT